MFDLKKIPTYPNEYFSNAVYKKKMEGFHQKLIALQNIFFVDKRFALLIVFQGIDNTARYETIRHVMSYMNPMGVQIAPFNQPKIDELENGFFWDIYPKLPPKGIIEVFHSSYYEDILMPYLFGNAITKNLGQKCQIVNSLENHLIRNEIHILKIFLHISMEEQKKRSEEQKKQPQKNWLFSIFDSKVTNKWDSYMEAFNLIINKCAKPAWHIIPADKMNYRNYAVTKVLSEYLETLPSA